MPRHHFVPQFLISKWATNGQINSFWWEESANKIIESAVAVRKACQVKDLNALFGVSGAERYTPEDNFTQKIDTPADEALKIILSDGIQGLSSCQRQAWARFLIAFPVRMPEHLREMGPRETRRGLKKAQSIAGGPPDLEKQITIMIEQNMPSYERNMPLHIAKNLAADLDKIALISNMNWWIIQFNNSDVLLGDRPLLAVPRMSHPCGIPLNNANCMIVLPITPDRVFFASTSAKIKAKSRDMPRDKHLHLINEETIACASKYVYSLNSSSAAFVIEALAKKNKSF